MLVGCDYKDKRQEYIDVARERGRGWFSGAHASSFERQEKESFLYLSEKNSIRIISFELFSLSKFLLSYLTPTFASTPFPFTAIKCYQENMSLHFCRKPLKNPGDAYGIDSKNVLTFTVDLRS